MRHITEDGRFIWVTIHTMNNSKKNIMVKRTRCLRKSDFWFITRTSTVGNKRRQEYRWILQTQMKGFLFELCGAVCWQSEIIFQGCKSEESPNETGVLSNGRCICDVASATVVGSCNNNNKVSSNINKSQICLSTLVHHLNPHDFSSRVATTLLLHMKYESGRTFKLSPLK